MQDRLSQSEPVGVLVFLFPPLFLCFFPPLYDILDTVLPSNRMTYPQLPYWHHLRYYQQVNLRASLFVLFLSVASAALIFQVEPKSRECFYGDIQSGQTSHLSYFVLRGGLLDIDMTLSKPNAEVIKTGIVFEARDSTFKPRPLELTCSAGMKWPGVHIPYHSSITDSGRWTAKVVQFEWDIRAEKEDNALKAGRPSVAMDQAVERISDSIDAIQIDQTYLKIREQSLRDTESTNERVLWFSILESIVLASISIGQVVMLRRFFECLQYSMSFISSETSTSSTVPLTHIMLSKWFGA
ncbi:hypothetical protein PROFUN_00670 [Planoprotostelium fungivorum]|uniref:GOLD domain-containing protein n=1 Tax=Planoprotostelium fungivorum TaxID=1890364 RepID=A0A2P6NU18_9EUKA|nr:hypothetical protein PROFUN_00670 [Planoprotostelium fungivorum]